MIEEETVFMTSPSTSLEHGKERLVYLASDQEDNGWVELLVLVPGVHNGTQKEGCAGHGVGCAAHAFVAEILNV